MNPQINPYEPPGQFQSDIHKFARYYAVDISKTDLREFLNITRRPFFGTCTWLAMQVGLIKFKTQVLDGPRPFDQDRCELSDIQEPVKTFLRDAQASAEQLGFHSPWYCMSISSGIVTVGGALRMLHRSGQYFLSCIAASSGQYMEGHHSLISAASQPVIVHSTTNNRPTYNPNPNIKVYRQETASLAQLITAHDRLVPDLPRDLIRFDSFHEVGTVMDHMSNLFYTDMVRRGIFAPHVQPTQTLGLGNG